MAAFYKAPASPGRVRMSAAPPPAPSFTWHVDAAGRLVRRWQVRA